MIISVITLIDPFRNANVNNDLLFLPSDMDYDDVDAISKQTSAQNIFYAYIVDSGCILLNIPSSCHSAE